MSNVLYVCGRHAFSGGRSRCPAATCPLPGHACAPSSPHAPAHSCMAGGARLARRANLEAGFVGLRFDVLAEIGTPSRVFAGFCRVRWAVWTTPGSLVRESSPEMCTRLPERRKNSPLCFAAFWVAATTFSPSPCASVAPTHALTLPWPRRRRSLGARAAAQAVAKAPHRRAFCLTSPFAQQPRVEPFARLGPSAPVRACARPRWWHALRRRRAVCPAASL